MRERRNVDRIQEELEELISDLWQVPGFVGRRRGFRPHVDCYVGDEPPAVTVVVDLAGVDPNAVEVTVGERAIEIRGVRRRPKQTCRVSYRHMEIEYGPFQRRIGLGEDVDPEGAEASYEQGLLTIVLPLAEKPATGPVTIKLGGGRTDRS